MSTIIRTKDKARGGITQQEQKAMVKHADLWIARAMRTEPIDRGKIVSAIEGIYAAAKLKKPIVVIVPSPLVMAFAYGASAAIWYRKKNRTGAATAAATEAATYAATYVATRAATDAATDVATDVATDAATRAATGAATDVATATGAATRAATAAATEAATYAATEAATDAATEAATYVATYVATDAATRAATRAATYAATEAATYAATDAATEAATRAATDVATRAATDAATDAATEAATYAATDAATEAATRAATDVATRAATEAATEAATDVATAAAAATEAANSCRDLSGSFGLECAKRWYSAYQGGNMWAGYDAYLTACRDILGLELREHAAYKHWEQAAIHGGFRVMHEEFCLVCDFPEIIKKDEENRPHCENGPSHRWRDGWSLYHWHGTRIPAEWIENRPLLTATVALSQSNLEMRRAACEILGWSNILEALDAKMIDSDDDPQIGTLVQVSLPDLPHPAKFLRVKCGTGREFAIGIPSHINKAIDAQAWIVGLEPNEFIRPEFRA